jgi:hypothetical protein
LEVNMGKRPEDALAQLWAREAYGGVQPLLPKRGWRLAYEEGTPLLVHTDEEEGKSVMLYPSGAVAVRWQNWDGTTVLVETYPNGQVFRFEEVLEGEA